MNILYYKEDDYNESILKNDKSYTDCWRYYLALGIAIFIYGMIVSDYVMITGIGVGTVMGAVFIFLIGMFLIATEEMLNKSHRITAKKESV